MNGWYNRINNVPAPVQMPTQQSFAAPQFQNPLQKMQYIMQAMTNPAAFVKQYFPDIPDQIANNGPQVLQYLQRTRGISNAQIQQLLNQNPRP